MWLTDGLELRVLTKNCIIPGSRPARGPPLRPFPIALPSFPVLFLLVLHLIVFTCPLSAVVIYVFLTCCVLPLKSITRVEHIFLHILAI